MLHEGDGAHGLSHRRHRHTNVAGRVACAVIVVATRTRRGAWPEASSSLPHKRGGVRGLSCRRRRCTKEKGWGAQPKLSSSLHEGTGRGMHRRHHHIKEMGREWNRTTDRQAAGTDPGPGTNPQCRVREQVGLGLTEVTRTRGSYQHQSVTCDGRKHGGLVESRTKAGRAGMHHH